MQYTKIPGTDMQASRICLGTMTFGSPVAGPDAVRLVRYALEEHGVNFIDTANMYEGYNRYAGSAGGVAEEIVGEAVAHRRGDYILATKVGMKVGEAPEDENTSPEAIRIQLRRSLVRMRTDYVDVYYLHRYDPDTEPHAVARAMGEELRAGTIRAWGVSNYTAAQLAALLAAAADEGVPAPALCQPALSMLNTGALEELLSQLQSSTADENTISCEFAEDVEIKQEYVPTDKVMNLGYLAELLYSTKTAETTYTVKAGDTWSEIAEDHGMTSKELLALNPGYNIDKIQIGEVLTLSEAVPYLTVTVKQREYYVEDVMYDVEYTDSAYLYKGDYQVTSPGEYGAADVVANVTYVNGVETERTILSSVTLKEPVTEQRLQGTKERPTWLPTGTFRWPISGRITSRFGGRASPGGIGSTNHQGIDIAGPYGTPVYAADGGTVTYSGWMGGYGYLVEINHGNGYVTRYGHNSSLTVSVGDHVYKGQQIARVGSTGNSTGNHCHFEIRYNGVARNPLNYLP